MIRSLPLVLCLTLVARPLFGEAPGAARVPRVDCQGDALPPEALARFGSVRFRHDDGVSALAYSPDGRFLASLCRDRVVRLWEAATGRLVFRFQEQDIEFQSLVFSPDSSALAAAGGNVQTGGSHAVHCWDTATGREIRRLSGHDSTVLGLAFSPDGAGLLATSSAQMVAWDTATGTVRHRWKNSVPIGGLAFAPDRKTLAWVGGEGEDKAVRLTDAVTGAEVGRLDGHSHGILALAFAPDGQRLASGNPFEPVRLWDVATGKVCRQFNEIQGGVALAFSPDGRLLASGSMEGTVRLWDVATGTEQRQCQGYHGWVNALTFSPDGKTLALAGCDARIVYRWEVATGKELSLAPGHQGPVHAVALSPDGKMLASGGGDKADGKASLRLWDAVTGTELRILEGEAGVIHGLVFSPDGKLLASAAEGEDVVRLWDAATGEELRRVGAAPEPSSQTATEPHALAFAFSPDGRCLAVGDSDRFLRLREVATGKELRRLEGHEGRVTAIAFSADGPLLASGSQDRTLRLWDVTTAQPIRYLGGPAETVKSVAFTPDGRLVAAACGDWQGVVCLWDVASGKELRRFPGRQGGVSQIAFSSDGKTLVASGTDAVVRLWEVATGKERKCLPGHPGGTHAVAFPSNGRTLVTGGADTTVVVWDVTGRADRGPRRSLAVDELEGLWDDLAGEDARQAYLAICTLAARPRLALPFLRARLQPLAPPSRQELIRLLGDLDDEHFTTRERATRQLANLGELAEPFLREGLAASSSLESRRRLELLLKRLQTPTPTPEHLRALRAFEILERIGSGRVREVLEGHAREMPTGRLGQEAQAALDRLSHRPR
jgi:WD40 repeat protein